MSLKGKDQSFCSKTVKWDKETNTKYSYRKWRMTKQKKKTKKKTKQKKKQLQKRLEPV